MKQIKMIHKEDVIYNFLELMEVMKKTDSFYGSMCSFYFKHEWLSLDWAEDNDLYDKVIKYIEKCDMQNLIYYYFILTSIDCSFVFSDIDKYGDLVKPNMDLEAKNSIFHNWDEVVKCNILNNIT